MWQLYRKKFLTEKQQFGNSASKPFHRPTFEKNFQHICRQNVQEKMKFGFFSYDDNGKLWIFLTTVILDLERYSMTFRLISVYSEPL